MGNWDPWTNPTQWIGFLKWNRVSHVTSVNQFTTFNPFSLLTNFQAKLKAHIFSRSILMTVLSSCHTADDKQSGREACNLCYSIFNSSKSMVPMAPLLMHEKFESFRLISPSFSHLMGWKPLDPGDLSIPVLLFAYFSHSFIFSFLPKYRCI